MHNARVHAAKLGFLTTIPLNMKFLKDIILKLGGKIDALSFPQPHFSFLKSPQIFAVVLFP